METQNRITNNCKEKIFMILLYGAPAISVGEPFLTYYDIWGRLTPKEFLARLYPLREMPALKPSFGSAEEEIAAIKRNISGHYPLKWLFLDSRFRFANGPDDNFLNFLCEIFHPNVRNDYQQAQWFNILQHLNEVLNTARYRIFPRDWIGLQAVYGWRDLESERFSSITESDLKKFKKLFVHSGNVIDFYARDDFDDFTRQAIDLPLCQCYIGSKGFALASYLDDCLDESKLLKLLEQLMLRYNEAGGGFGDEKLQEECQNILGKAIGMNKALNQAAETLKVHFDSTYLSGEIDAMLALQTSNPTEAIGKAKELIESCCKTILEKTGAPLPSNTDFSQIVKKARSALHLLPEGIPDTAPASTAIKQLLSNLAAIAHNIATLRNVYGSGHGKSSSYRGLEERHAKLAVECSVALVSFLWDSFKKEHPRK
jgi:hypothetical protein